MKLVNRFAALAAMGFLTILIGCADAETPFALQEEPETFTVEVLAKPSASDRTDGTNIFWFAGATATFSTDFTLEDEHSDEHAKLGDGGGAQVEGEEHHEEGDGHHEEEEPQHEEAEEHHDDDHGEPPTFLGTTQVSGYDIRVEFLSPQHIRWWNRDTSSWETEDPLSEHDRYLMVRLGSSAGTRRHPHVHGTWSDPDVTEEEEELAEEEFGGMRQIVTGSEVRLSIEGTTITNAALREVETSHGTRYGQNFLLGDGTYDISVTVEPSEWDRLSDAEDSWLGHLTFNFDGVAIDTATGDGSTDIYGRNNRLLDDPDAHFVVIHDFDPLGHGHLHEMYLENHVGHASQELHSGTDTLVGQLRAKSAQNLYENGVYVSPQEPVAGEAIYIEVVLFDPKGLLHHGGDDFFDLGNTGATVVITNDQSGEEIEIHSDDLRPTYSHRYGFHYGANIPLPAGGPVGTQEEDGGDGHGHDHG